MKIVRAIFYSGLIFILVLTSCNQGGSSNQSSTDVQTKPEGQEVPKDSLVLLEELKSKRSALDSQIQVLETQLIQKGALEPKFKEVVIGKQIWMAENLNVDKFRNGDPILEVMTGAEWERVSGAPWGEGLNGKITPAWCYHGNNPENGAKLGKLYNWYAVNDPRGLAPKGWHIPSKKEWQELADYLGTNEAGTKMKSRSGWGSACNNTNSSGFSALPGGDRSSNGGVFYGRGEAGLGERCNFWSSSENDYGGATYFYLYCTMSQLGLNTMPKGDGYSVRCIKD